MKPILHTLSAAIFAVGIGAAMAGPAAAEMSAAMQRQAAMKAIGGHMKALGAVAKRKAAYSVAIPVHAQAIHDAALTMGLLFPDGSGGAGTRAKPEIWTDAAGFSAKIDALAAVTPTLVAAAKTGDAGAIGGALKIVGKYCGGCHKPYRVPKK
ncbi:MAG: cytochrome c [Rhodospirillaceae bacterium]|jgi:cytochrome c556|nr:cytochrome c [Rhodospirillaceae bacterium]MBT3493142.1 cytochrome c [Rhodospirillaceae bacterium]MBT3779737.1 cytochrome c [Rhodospirillaceae bacterium]MBT3975977.1 cytochrome c [Rhodospirillaceae bacterium]MBT4563490.1 cytochrome c [Rhodospirillaceae bacterium]